MITLLTTSEQSVAEEVYGVFQRSYAIEADYIGVTDFPPLARTRHDIKTSSTQFFGYRVEDELAAVIELSISSTGLSIDSLTVDPAHFKKGLASALIEYALHTGDYPQALVETASDNTPAINLYMKHGFHKVKLWTPSHGIEKVLLVRVPETKNE